MVTRKLESESRKERRGPRRSRHLLAAARGHLIKRLENGESNCYSFNSSRELRGRFKGMTSAFEGASRQPFAQG